VSTIDTDEFKRLLLEERARLTRSSSRLEADVREGTNDFSGDLSVSGAENHLGDNASDTYERELDEGLDEGVRDTLWQIDAALKRIEDGTYGICAISGEPIGVERLRAIPWTDRCIDHAE
jgi:RNA polymerase-binding transcription factor DksA